MPELLIRIKKKADGSAALSCRRADGSVTWQRQEGRQGRFFPIHDLTHSAVETVLGHRRGFYGLVAEGWDLTDFGAPWPKGRLPADLDPSELLVGFLDTERAGGVRWSADDFNEKAALFYQQHGLAGVCKLSDVELGRIRTVLAELMARWRALPAGEALELAFDRRPGRHDGASALTR
jgi:hypothetical protein